jgi:hypothetical protein
VSDVPAETPPPSPPPQTPPPVTDPAAAAEAAAQARDQAEGLAKYVFAAALIWVALHGDDDPPESSLLVKAAKRLALRLLRSRNRQTPSKVRPITGEARARWVDDEAERIVKLAVGDAKRHYATVEARMRKAAPGISDRMIRATFRTDTAWSNAAARTAATRFASEIAMGMREAVEKDTGQNHSLLWISRGDPKVRKLHRELHGRVRPPGTPFQTWQGGQELRFPGDPKAPLDAVINCRCALMLVPTADAKFAEAVFSTQDADFDVPMAAGGYLDALERQAYEDLLVEMANQG